MKATCNLGILSHCSQSINLIVSRVNAGFSPPVFRDPLLLHLCLARDSERCIVTGRK